MPTEPCVPFPSSIEMWYTTSAYRTAHRDYGVPQLTTMTQKVYGDSVRVGLTPPFMFGLSCFVCSCRCLSFNELWVTYLCNEWGVCSSVCVSVTPHCSSQSSMTSMLYFKQQFNIRRELYDPMEENVDDVFHPNYITQNTSVIVVTPQKTSAVAPVDLYNHYLGKVTRETIESVA